MMREDRIRTELANCLDRCHLPELGPVERGKVRDSYRVGDLRVLVTTDRISAFDVVLGTIPFKGQVLNRIAAFWFDQTRGVAPNHVVAVPDPCVMVVRECEQVPVEFIVRGYLTGVTKTSAWYNYQNGVRNLCGNVLPEGMRKDQAFAKPILTPTTKLEAHDRSISREEAIAEGLLDAATFDTCADICFRLYAAGVEHARKQGLILVDTKYELGRRDGAIVVSDEIHTPDSSRYWFAEDYAARFAAGKEQRKLDKEYVREWYAAQGYRGDGTPPALIDDVRVEAARRYIEAFERVTGLAFEVDDRPASERIRANLKAAGLL